MKLTLYICLKKLINLRSHETNIQLINLRSHETNIIYMPEKIILRGIYVLLIRVSFRPHLSIDPKLLPTLCNLQDKTSNFK